MYETGKYDILEDTFNGLDDDDQEELDSYLGKYLLNVRNHLS